MGDSHTGPFQPVSKYIGETEANLHRLENAAESAGSPELTLEESAALFGERGGPAAGFGGIYRGVCVNAVDPLLQSRLQVSVPAVPDVSGAWAQACLPPGWSGSLPAPGDGVWVMFEGGDASYPVWIGVRA
jgi:hypothetical protein